MNRLVIIGNGFDMAHGLKTSYKDFINWYWEERVKAFSGNTSTVSQDCLCNMSIIDNNKYSSWNVFAFSNSYFNDIPNGCKYTGTDVIHEIKEHPEIFSFECSPFFDSVQQSIETKGWVDIENDYYQLLKHIVNKQCTNSSVRELNSQLSYLQDRLIEYLGTIKNARARSDLYYEILGYLNPNDFSTEGKKKALDNIGLKITDLDEPRYNNDKRNKFLPEKIMMLSFNYTETARLYGNFNLTYNYIHGELNNPKYITRWLN